VKFSLRHEHLALALRVPFRIARDLDTGVAHTVLVELTSDAWPGHVGIGEGFPDAYYGETPGSMATVFPLLLDAIDPGQFDIADIPRAQASLARAADAFARVLGRNGAAKCALDIALHDLVAKQLGVPLHTLLGTTADIPPTDFTVGIDDPAVVAERAASAAHFPALKVKVGSAHDLETLRAVRSVFAGPIRVDANTGWQPEEAERLIPQLVELGVELIEQPFPAHRLDQLAWLQERSPLPIVADESAVMIEDLDRLVGVVAGVNVKLAKCGGVGPALQMLTRARDLGFRRFLGCMEETSVGIAASAAVASLADWVDLDGCLLLADDPFAGLTLGSDCRWMLPPLPGLGLTRTGSAPV
jgi:L-alanine-DL-glutamate epimerase-like enolase superfamily enzyme